MRTRIETKGSIWLLDNERGQYCRLPKTEGPRTSPPGEDWGGPGADVGLQDLVWHDFASWEIQDVTVPSYAVGAPGIVIGQRLVIQLLDSAVTVTAPDPIVREG